MDKEQILELIKELKSNVSTLDELEQIARRYHYQSLPHNLDKKVLYNIELLHEKVGTILLHFYMGDLDEKFFRGEISQEDYTKITNSPFAKYQYSSSAFLYNEKYIKDFSIKDKDFIFNLGKGSCYRLLHGICSLDIDDHDIESVIERDFKETNWFSDDHDELIEYLKSKENSVLYCRSLAESIQKDGFKSAIYINHYKCNHYDFTDGQHRTCISSKLNIPLPANVSDMTLEDYCCPICQNKIKNQNLIKINKHLSKNKSHNKPFLNLLDKLKIRKATHTTLYESIDNQESEFIKK